MNTQLEGQAMFTLRRVSTLMLCCAGLALWMFGHGSVAQQTVPPPGSRFYQATDGKVDAGTRRGWEVFHRTCYVCHGVDATGTDIAPDLTKRVKGMTVTEFSNLVLNRYRIVAPMNAAQADNNVIWREQMIKEMERHERGQRGELMMPAWEKNFRVRPHLIDIFAYLQARSDGALGAGEPQLLPEKD